MPAQTGTQAYQMVPPRVSTPLNTGSSNSATHAAASVTLAQTAGVGWILSNILWSYSADPTATATLTIAWGSNTITLAITKGGPGSLPLTLPIRFPTNTAVTITLADGGTSIVGTVYVAADPG